MERADTTLADAGAKPLNGSTGHCSAGSRTGARWATSDYGTRPDDPNDIHPPSTGASCANRVRGVAEPR